MLTVHEHRLAVVATICLVVIVGTVLGANSATSPDFAPRYTETTKTYTFTVAWCDVNQDGNYDIGDIVSIGHIIYGNARGTGDCNNDGVTDINDQIDALTYLFNTQGTNKLEKDAEEQFTPKIALGPTTLPTICDAPFIRGDANNDNNVNIADAVFALNALFVPNSLSLACTDQADTNDDGTANIADVIYLLNSLFVPNSQPIPEPNLISGPGYDEQGRYNGAGQLWSFQDGLDNDLDGDIDEGEVYTTTCDVGDDYDSMAGECIKELLSDPDDWRLQISSTTGWDTVHDAACASLPGPSPSPFIGVRNVYNDQNGFSEIYRASVPFDTSALVGKTVTGAALELTPYEIQSFGLGGYYIVVTDVVLSQETPPMLQDCDYGQFNTMELSNQVPIGSVTSLTPVEFDITTDGLNAIDQSGWTTIGLRGSWDVQDTFAGNSGPVGTASVNIGAVRFYSSEDGPALSPKLLVRYVA